MQVPRPAPSAARNVATLDNSGSVETALTIDQVDQNDGECRGSGDDANDQDISTAAGAAATAASKFSVEGNGGCNDESRAPGDGEAGNEGNVVAASSTLVDGVLSALPTFARMYALGPPGLYACYVNDELGSAFRHSERPNYQVMTLIHTVAIDGRIVKRSRGDRLAVTILDRENSPNINLYVIYFSPVEVTSVLCYVTPYHIQPDNEAGATYTRRGGGGTVRKHETVFM